MNYDSIMNYGRSRYEVKREAFWRIDVETHESFHRLGSLSEALLSLVSLVILASVPRAVIRVIAIRFLGQLSAAYRQFSTKRVDIGKELMRSCTQMMGAKQLHNTLADQSKGCISHAALERELAATLNARGHNVDQKSSALSRPICRRKSRHNMTGLKHAWE